MNLKPFCFSNSKLSSGINFMDGNRGINIKFQLDEAKNSLIFKVSNIYLSNVDSSERNWDTDKNSLKSYNYPLENKALLFFAKEPCTYAQWGTEEIDVFWKSEVLKISAEAYHGSYLLHIKECFWNGRVYTHNDSRVVERHNNLSMSSRADFIIDLSDHEKKKEAKKVVGVDTFNKELERAIVKKYKSEINEKIEDLKLSQSLYGSKSLFKLS